MVIKMNEGELKNRRIIIKNTENDQVIADTRIIRYNSSSNSVMISAASLLEKKFYNISAFIFSENSLYESYGTIRGTVTGNEIEVFLGKSREKEDRAKTRYPISVEGNVKGIYIDDKEISLHRGIHIETINMSANGILIKADAGSFDTGEMFTLVLEMGKDTLELQCEVVRIQSGKELLEEYGCRIDEIKVLQGKEQK
ncbi:MAG: PilZ domain-containing protein [Lachnospiraceae bacterium]|nr:PilZ domain-containing protein [Lachnospiraceae bacterium]